MLSLQLLAYFFERMDKLWSGDERNPFAQCVFFNDRKMIGG